MKILVLQLARLGDIFQVWPSLKALKRNYPDCNIDLVVRKKFSAATIGLEVLDQVIELDTAEILKPCICSDEGLTESILLLEDLLFSLENNKYDKVINLSFSPLSSYITSFLSYSVRDISGYSRHSDGYLSIPDDTSAYFYAQVGTDKYNRIHLSDIFAAVCGVDLLDEDWGIKSINPPSRKIYDRLQEFIHLNDKKIITIHIASSQEEKSFPPFKWKQVINKLIERGGVKIILIGSSAEKDIVEKIIPYQESKDVLDLVGLTTIPDLHDIVQKTKLVLGADSMLIQLSSLMNRASINVSFDTVRFWETGPTSPGSRIIKTKNPEMLSTDMVVSEVFGYLNREKNFPDTTVYVGERGLDRYTSSKKYVDDFEWSLIEALYMEKEFPYIENPLVISGLRKIHDVLEVADQQLKAVQDGKDLSLGATILNEVDRIIIAVSKLVPSLQPLIAWFETEKLRIPPGELSEILQDTIQKYKEFEIITSFLLQKVNSKEGLGEKNKVD